MFFTNIHKILIFTLILLPEQQIGALWYETFQSSLVANEYSAENQVKSWQNWLEKGSLVIRCIDVKKYQKTHTEVKTLTNQEKIISLEFFNYVHYISTKISILLSLCNKLLSFLFCEPPVSI